MGSGAGCRFSIILYLMPKDAEELTTIESLFDAAPSVALVLHLRSSKIEGGVGLPVLFKSRSMYGIHKQTSNHWRKHFLACVCECVHHTYWQTPSIVIHVYALPRRLFSRLRQNICMLHTTKASQQNHHHRTFHHRRRRLMQ